MSYDPTIGRFISQDPIAFDGGDSNLYRYTTNDPADLSDLSGLQGKPLQNEDTYLNPDVTPWFPGYTKLRQQYPNFPGGWEPILADPGRVAAN